jgi:predicted dehydrogenase
MELVAGCNCDVDWVEAAKKEEFTSQYGIENLKWYTDYDQMLEHEDLDVMFVGTGMDSHVPLSIKAMRCGLHVISEVTAAVSVEQCRELLNVLRETGKNYVLAENALFLKENYLITELTKKGFLGELYYAEGEYLHDIKTEANKPWRRKYCYDTGGITYGTHPLGPILHWMNERVDRVCCVGAGHHFSDSDGTAYKAEAAPVMLCKTVSGKLIKIGCDLMSERPHATTNFMLQGTKGCYESSRIDKWDGPYRIWLKGMTAGDVGSDDIPEENTEKKSKEPEWESLWNYEEYLADFYKTEKAKEFVSGCGHRGSDYFTGYAIGEILLNKRPNILGIYEALDMTLPGLLSQESIKRDGEWVKVPDPREW